MYYQLPNGKTVYLSVEEYLSLTDADIQYLISINAGEYIPHIWTDSGVLDQETEEFLEVEDLETYFEEFFPDEFEEDVKPNLDLDI